MGAPLKVAPAGLRSAAAAETSVGEFISGLRIGERLASAAAAMPGLQSGAACGEVGPVIDTTAQGVGSEVGAHANKLTYAADAYQRTDEEYARRLNPARPMS
ncbi:phage tail tape-measure protein [Mycobacterium frederiksbergense]|uniref:Phage tail tape-measure protein n=1 Tax=Mycolicibacterium frederiksbergense TaxID=117567 RepID=A0ABT6L573_9MYCO|nr:type VII secretion target [Mycolicibacterium frederiksbergense]MDH6198075.1 phage tail tape-measure protein [Mycolicibacterium frederiksbergense]